MRRPHGFYSKMTPERLYSFGVEMGYDKISRNDLYKVNRTFYRKSLQEKFPNRERVIDKLIPYWKGSGKNRFKRQWKWETRDEWIKYGLKQKYNRLSRSEVCRRDNTFYSVGTKNNWFDGFIPSLYRHWNSKKDWIEFGRERGYDKLNRGKLNDVDGAYYNVGLDKKWLSSLIPNLLRKRWKSKSEWISYGKSKGYDKLSRSRLRDTDSKFYYVGTRRKWVKTLIPDTKHDKSKFKIKRRKRLWTKEEWLSYGRERGYDKLSRDQLEDKDQGYYQSGRRRDWLYFLIPKSRTQNVRKFISQDPVARNLVNVASLNQSYGDVAHILTELWPERFPSEEKLAQQLPQAIPKVTAAISPIQRFEASFRGIYQALPAESVPVSLENLIYRIGIDTYQIDFNRNPEETLARLRNLSRELTNKEAKLMMRRIYSWYNDVYNFSIPGVGSIQQRYKI